MVVSGKHRGGSRLVWSWRVGVVIAVVLALVISLVVAVASLASSGASFVAGRELATDTFGRVVEQGWGSAESGGAYTLSAPQHFSTDGALAHAVPPRGGASLSATLEEVDALDVRVSTELVIPPVPEAGNGLYSGVTVRATPSSYYLARVRLAPNGSVTLSILRVVGSTAKQVTLVQDAPLLTTATPGDTLRLDVDVTGTDPVELTVRAFEGAAENPASEVRIADDGADRLATSGAIGLWSYVSRGTEPAAFVIDTLTAVELVPATPESPTPTPTSDGPDDPAPDTRDDPGAVAVGTATYDVPDDAVFAVPGTAGSGDGSERAPLPGLAAAIKAAPTGATIVLREGSYHGTFTVPRQKKLTIQPYPGEAVWLDGSRVVDDFIRDGSAWRVDGWDIHFDASPTYARGKPDGTAPGWRFVDPAFPMAAHPDQVWIDGVAQVQVGSRSQVTAGRFYVDERAEKLYLGSDPSGRDVRASDSVRALVVAGNGSTVRGIGVARYAPSVPDIGAVAISGVDVTLENVTITDTATTGLAVFASNATLRDLTITRSGMLGAQASTADGLEATGLLVTDNNTEHFNRAPVSGGFKIHKSRGVEVRDSAFLRNRGNALWFDESVYDMTIVGNDIRSSIGSGLVIELSAQALVADNVIQGSTRDGILVSDSGHIDIWNNTIDSNDRSINIVQGTRRASNLGLPGHDARQKLPDPTVTWITEDITVSNNILSVSRGKCILCVEDHSHERSAAQMQVRSNGNVFQRPATTAPSWAVVWSRGPGNPEVFTSLAAFSEKRGQDTDSLALDERPALDGTVPTPEVTALESSIARALPAEIAAGVQRPAGAKHLGAWD